MQFNFSYSIGRDDLETALRRFVRFLNEQHAETVSSLKITCHPWRNGKRLQAVNARGEIRPVTFDLEPSDERHKPPASLARDEVLTIRERPDDLGDTGLAAAFDHDD